MTSYIAITGTHSTGKSTLLEEAEAKIRSQGLHVARVSDKASDCRDAGFPILQDHTFESTLWIMTSVIRGELEAGRSADVVLVDRPVGDALAYLEAALQTQGRQISPGERAYLYMLAHQHSARYALTLRTVLDASIPLGPDRDPDLGFRSVVNDMIGLIAPVMTGRVINVTPDRREFAITEILKILEPKIGFPRKALMTL